MNLRGAKGGRVGYDILKTLKERKAKQGRHDDLITVMENKLVMQREHGR